MARNSAVSLPAAPQPRVSIVVVAAKHPSRLVRCLAAVANETPPGILTEVVVVLNAADASLQEALDREVEGATVVASEVPLGFAGGSNLGAEHARGDLLHLLHDDTEVCPGWLEALVAALDDHPQAGAAGSMLLDFDGTVQAAGHVLWRDGRTTPPWAGEAPDPASFGADPFPVDYCGSASVLIRRELWDTAGGANEELHPAYYVDVDLALAVRNLGRTVLCAPRSLVRHERGGSSRAGFRRFVVERNRSQIAVRWADALELQEPFAAGHDALERAKKATLRHAVSLHPAPVAPRPRAKPKAEVRLLRERNALLRDIDVKDAYLAELDASHRAALEEISRLAHGLDLIETGGWWRLRGRLLPLLAALGWLRRLSRRGRTSRTE